MALVLDSPAITATKDLARRYAERAVEALGGLPPGPAHTTLRALTDYAIDRRVSQRPGLDAAFN